MDPRIPDECTGIAEGLPEDSVKKAVSAAYGKRLLVVSKRPLIVFFMGENRDHVILPYTYCNCRDYMVNVLSRGIRGYCYHMLAYCIGYNRGLLRDYIIDDKVLLSSMIREIIKYNRSASLRKILSLGKK